MWISVEPAVNALRRRLSLPPIDGGEAGWDLLNYNKVMLYCLHFWMTRNEITIYI